MPKRIVIIGGGTAGASAAFSARKADRKAEITVLNGEPYPTYSRCGLPFVIKGIIPSFENLIVFNEKFYHSQKINHRFNTTVTDINHKARQILFRQHNPGRPLPCLPACLPDRQAGRTLAGGPEVRLSYDALIIATGAVSVKPSIKGVALDNVFTLRTMDDAKAILISTLDVGTKKTKSAVIIGASFIGLELAEALRERGLEVTLVGSGYIMWRAVDKEISKIISQHLNTKGINILERTIVREINPVRDSKSLQVEIQDAQNGTIPGACLPDRQGIPPRDGITDQIRTDLIILSKGTRPEVSLARRTAGITIGKMGGIVVNDKLSTNLEDVYAAGDCTETISPLTGEPVVSGLGTVATRQGMVAGANATGANDAAPSIFNASVCRIFGLEIGSIGFTESHLKEHHTDKFVPISILVKYPSLPHYYPGGTDIYIKLIANAQNSQLLGAQIVGQSAVAQRINTLAVAFEKKCSVIELTKADFCYSPAVSDLWDPLAIAAQSLARKINKSA